jgi:demethylmenaquinone methyltransferase/2-methoxy-6-polyprenyl-1,4-benzoquinol methylase
VSERVRQLFSAIAWRYDTANAVISLGQHGRWRRQLIATGMRGANPTIRPGARILDCATGTGDVAMELIRRVGPRGSVVGVDFTPEMLELARAKVGKLQSSWLEVPGEAEAAAKRRSFEEGDVLRLRFADREFDAVTISFGVRNLDDPALGLAEMARVVRPGGSVLILETGQPRNRVLRWLYHGYTAVTLRTVGRAISGHPEAYSYLERTVWSFPCGAEFVALMRATGAFSTISAEPLIDGVAWIYHGIVKQTNGPN